MVFLSESGFNLLQALWQHACTRIFDVTRMTNGQFACRSSELPDHVRLDADQGVAEDGARLMYAMGMLREWLACRRLKTRSKLCPSYLVTELEQGADDLAGWLRSLDLYKDGRQITLALSGTTFRGDAGTGAELVGIVEKLPKSRRERAAG